MNDYISVYTKTLLKKKKATGNTFGPWSNAQDQPNLYQLRTEHNTCRLNKVFKTLCNKKVTDQAKINYSSILH